MTPPAGICRNCFAVWRAAKPRPIALHCWHASVVAEPDGSDWKITANVGKVTLERLRTEGKL